MPIDWMSSAAAIELRMFLMKDALCCVDDYVPLTDARAQRGLEQKAHSADTRPMIQWVRPQPGQWLTSPS